MERSACRFPAKLKIVSQMPATKSVANWPCQFAQETGTAGLSFAFGENRQIQNSVQVIQT
jgi:hypothetical protein